MTFTVIYYKNEQMGSMKSNHINIADNIKRRHIKRHQLYIFSLNFFHTFWLNLFFLLDSEKPQKFLSKDQWRSTGLYVKAGTVVTITVPTEVVGKIQAIYLGERQTVVILTVGF